MHKLDRVLPKLCNVCRLEAIGREKVRPSLSGAPRVTQPFHNRDRVHGDGGGGSFNECKLTILHFKLAIKCNRVT